LHAMQALSQLSYDPTGLFKSMKPDCPRVSKAGGT
jgi:hypothetical protein